jgi:hypothetical protein
MSSIHFQIAQAVGVPAAEATYSKSGYTLTLGPSGRVPQGMHRLTIDSLTLAFMPVEHHLVALDAYTNFALWERVRLKAPSADHTGALMCLETFDENGIAGSISDPVNYSYSQDSQLLRIRLQDTGPQIAAYVRCLDCAICGLGPEHELIEIWIERLRFVP